MAPAASNKLWTASSIDIYSRDRTVEIAGSLGATVVPEPRPGYGRAYKTGFAKAQGEFVATLDTDATYPPERFPKFLRMLDDRKADLVLGERLTGLDPRAMGRKHRFGNWLLNATTKLLFGFRLKDSQTGMWVFRRSILDRLETWSDGMAFSEGFKIEALRKGARVQEIHVSYGLRAGEAKLKSWADGWGNFKFLLSKQFLGKRLGRRANPPLVSDSRG